LTVIALTTTASVAALAAAALMASISLIWLAIALLALGRGILLADHRRSIRRLQGGSKPTLPPSGNPQSE
jgi:membrane protein implicated in regulation of membrane protease activity